MQACSACPFRVSARGTIAYALVDQMPANAEAIGGFTCHMRHPDNDILSCRSREENANDCVGYQRMLANLPAPEDVHPDFVGCFDELIR
ncbi:MULTISPECIES: hypothetical protein [Cupriavidus]